MALPLGELSPQVTERAGMVMVCPLRPRCARPPLPGGEARDAHTAHQNVCRGGWDIYLHIYTEKVWKT